MTLQEIGERLKAEFPGKTYKVFQAEARIYDGEVTGRLNIYQEGYGWINECESLEDAIAKMKQKMQPEPPVNAGDFEVSATKPEESPSVADGEPVQEEAAEAH